MTKDEMRAVLSRQLAKFRSWTYTKLAERVEQDQRAHECLDSSEGVAADGTSYFIEFNAYWDDQPRGDVRVCGYLFAGSQRPLWGFIPIATSDEGECFIMNRGGRFVGEDETPA